jgi:5-methylcytosine-specific restriction endonuclease McrA
MVLTDQARRERQRAANRASYRKYRAARSLAAAKRYLENKEEFLARNRAWWEKNKEKVKANGRRWRKENREKVKISARRTREKYKEKYREQDRVRYRENREKERARNRVWCRESGYNTIKAGRRRARILGTGGKHTSADRLFVWRLQRGKCAYSKFVLPWCSQALNEKNRQWDHIVPVTRGGSDDRFNGQWLCAGCNNRKWNRLESEFLHQCGVEDLFVAVPAAQENSHALSP